jgi:UDP-N-acetylmuramate--alanine ligase
MIGAAGSGMRSLAALLSQAGWQLTGSDATDTLPADWPSAEDVAVGALPPQSRVTDTLPNIPLHGDHHAGRVHAELDLVIYSDAIPGDNAERCRARQLGIPTLSYPAALGELLRGRRGMAVAGTHGKSTTAAMLAEIFEAAGADPTYVFGATRRDGRPGGRLGRGPWMIAEACEYRANFCHLQPEIALLTGIEPDHFDYYDSPASLEQAYRRFVEGVSHGGALLYCADCAISSRLARERLGRNESFGMTADALWQAQVVDVRDSRHRFAIRRRDVLLGELQLAVPARHNVPNALAAAATASLAGIGWSSIRDGLEAFAGLERRLEVVLDEPRLAVVDDFAHLPTEIAAGLTAVRQMYPGRRLCCVFQPHQVSRTAWLLDELAASLQNADSVIVADIFRARERDAAAGEVTAGDLADRVAALGACVVRVASDAEIPGRLFSGLQDGDVLVTMGAGNIGKIAHGTAQRIRENHSPQ